MLFNTESEIFAVNRCRLSLVISYILLCACLCMCVCVFVNVCMRACLFALYTIYCYLAVYMTNSNFYHTDQHLHNAIIFVKFNPQVIFDDHVKSVVCKNVYYHNIYDTSGR